MKTIYNPYNSKDYYIIEENGKKYFQICDLILQINESGYIPKSGLLYDLVLNENNCENKKVLDLGCGYLGILGIIAYLNKAKSVDSIDCDSECVVWFNKLIASNNLDKIHCFKSDYFQKINDHNYDMILANPPQMPMISGSVHDSGGIDGRKYIISIMDEAINYLSDNGNLYILLFDFLGIDNRTNKDLSIIELARNIGYSNYKLYNVAEKIIKCGVTYESLPHIRKIYPLYDFGIKSEEKCKIKILKLEK